MLQTLLPYFQIAVSMIGILLGVALAWMNRSMPFANRLLSVCLSIGALALFVNALVLSSLILHVPHLYRTLHPLAYLSSPLAYFHVRAAIRQESRLRPRDYLHFLPALFYLVDMAPFYLWSANEKVAYLRQLLRDPSHIDLHQAGQFPVSPHPLLYSSLSVVYLILRWRILFRWLNQVSSADKALKQWLFLFNGVSTPIVLLVLIDRLLWQRVPLNLYSDDYFILGSLLTLYLYLFFNPSFVYGLEPVRPEPAPAPEPAPEPNLLPARTLPRPTPLPLELQEDYQQRLGTYLGENKAYLQKGYTIRQLAGSIDIPPHQLSALLNGVYGMNFNDFINRYRVNYVRERMNQPSFRQLTLEGMAWEAGFNSRSTFFRAFTRVTGQTPSDYLENERRTESDLFPPRP